MNPLIQTQIVDALILFYAGVAVMLCYQLYEAYRRRFHPKGLILLVEELLFWIFAALLVTAFLYYSSYGQISFHAAAAFFTGAAVWRFLLGRRAAALIGTFGRKRRKDGTGC